MSALPTRTFAGQALPDGLGTDDAGASPGPAAPRLRIAVPQPSAQVETAATAELLRSNLQRQLEMHSRLLKLAHQQAAAVAARRVLDVHELLQEIEMVLLDRSKLEMQRTQIMGRLALELGVPVDDVDLGRITATLPAADAERLTTLAGELRATVDELGPLVATNRRMIEQELELIDGVVRMATTTGEKATYERPGDQASAETRALLDLQV